MKKNRYIELIINVVIFGIGLFLSKVIAIFLLPLYTKYLSTNEYGLSEILNNTVQIIIPLITLSIIEAVFRFSIDVNGNKKQIFNISLRIILIGIFISYPFIYLFGFLGVLEKYNIFFLLLISQVIYSLTTNFARGLGHTKRFVLAGIINSILLVLFSYMFIVANSYGISGYLMAIILSQSISAIFIFLVSKEFQYLNLGRVDKILFRAMLLYSIPQMVNAASWWINSMASRYILLLYSGASVAGIFIAATKIPSMVSLFTEIFQKAWQYSTAKEVQSETKNVFFERVYGIFSVIFTLLTMAAIVFTPFYTKLLLKGDFFIAWKYVPFLLIAALFGAYSTFFGTIYTAVKENKYAMYSTLIGAVLNILITFILVPKYGIFGVVIASIITYLVITVIRMIHTKKYINFPIQPIKFIIAISILVFQSFIIIVFENQGVALSSIGIPVYIFVYRKDFYLVINYLKQMIHR